MFMGNGKYFFHIPQKWNVAYKTSKQSFAEVLVCKKEENWEIEKIYHLQQNKCGT